MVPCIITDGNVRFKAELSCSIKELMPYLNATIKNATYNPEKDTIFFTKGVRVITLTDKHLRVLRAIDQTDAFKTIDFIKDTINETYENRDNITPIYDKKVRTTALEIFSYLPRTNCKVCGEPTCLAFAVKLLLGDQGLSACTPLIDDEKYKDQRKEMETLVDTMGLKLEA
jgi:ArsR family metal-binding transcriptional regulator